jgi:hypothetical protein
VKPVNINRLAWVFDQAYEFAGRLPRAERLAEMAQVYEAKRELEKYLGKRIGGGLGFEGELRAARKAEAL